MYIDRTGKSRQRSRASQKRTWLTNLLSLGAGVTVSVVGSVAYSYDGVTLPTRVGGGNPVVRSNPYVASPESPVASVGGGIRQTSDLQRSELQLKTIGTAVGLVPIGNPRPTQPVLEVSRPSQAKVRINPMATKPASNFDLPVIGLVEEQNEIPKIATEPAEPQPENATEVVSKRSMRILGLRYVESAIPDVLPSAPVETEATIQEYVIPTQGLNVAGVEPTEMVAASPVEDEPAGISFSFSDFGGDDSGGDGSGVTVDETVSVEVPAREPAAEVTELADGLMIPPPEEVSFQREPTELVQAVEDDSQKLGDDAVIDSLPLLPTPNPAWTRHTNADSLVAGNGSTVIRYPERRKAHVEVASPPMISFLQDSSQNSKNATEVESTRIIPAKLARFRVASAESSPVDDRDQVNEQKQADPLVALNAKIRKSYSTARLQLTKVKGKMLVRGTCATQEDATEIIRMIRNEFLVPVDDQIVIR